MDIIYIKDMINLFFTGFKMPFKRYKPYFPGLDLINPDIDIDIENIDNKDKKISIMTHSVGLIKALIFCMNNKINPVIILAIDPPDISEHVIAQKLNNLELPDDLLVIYRQYNELVAINGFPDLQIHLYRNIKNKHYMDKIYYESVCYYESDTHYPYMDRLSRDHIVKIYENKQK